MSSDNVPQVHLLISWSTPHSLNFSSSKCYRLISGVTTTIIDTCQMFNCFFLLKGNKHTKIGGLCYILMYPILGTYTVIYSFRETTIFLQVSPCTRINNQLRWLLGTNRKRSTKDGWRWQLLFSMLINATLSVTRPALCNPECFV